MAKIQHIIKVGDSVELYNGVTGKVVNTDESKYAVEIEGNGYYHIVNIKKLNGKEIDGDTEYLSL
jgi:ribosomal protein L21E